MNNESSFARLLGSTAVALVVCGGLVLICYFFVDRPVATYVYDQRFADLCGMKWLTYPPPVLQAWAPLVIVMLMITRVWRSPHDWERALLAACISLILADQFRESLVYVFSRTWPETWIDNNPSFIQDGAFGFHPFHGGSAYGSFPSGHTARAVAIAAVVWIACPKWRAICVLAAISVAVGLIGMNYHFVGDVIAGAFVGGIVGMYTYYCCVPAPR